MDSSLSFTSAHDSCTVGEAGLPAFRAALAGKLPQTWSVQASLHAALMGVDRAD